MRAYLAKRAAGYDEVQRFFYEVVRIADAPFGSNIEKYALQNARSSIVTADGWRNIQTPQKEQGNTLQGDCCVLP